MDPTDIYYVVQGEYTFHSESDASSEADPWETVYDLDWEPLPSGEEGRGRCFRTCGGGGHPRRGGYASMGGYRQINNTAWEWYYLNGRLEHDRLDSSLRLRFRVSNNILQVRLASMGEPLLDGEMYHHQLGRLPDYLLRQEDEEEPVHEVPEMTITTEELKELGKKRTNWDTFRPLAG